MYLNNYYYIRSTCTWALQRKYDLLCQKNTSLITVLHLENGAQLLNATSVLLAASTVIFPVTKINASE